MDAITVITVITTEQAINKVVSGSREPLSIKNNQRKEVNHRWVQKEHAG